MKRSFRIAVLLLGLALGASCAGGTDTMTSLRNSLEEFHEGFRWNAPGSMLPHVAPNDQAAFLNDYNAAMERISIAEYEVGQINIAEDSESALVWLRISWYDNSDMTIRNATVRERWLADGTSWMRAEAHVVQGELPGIPAASEPYVPVEAAPPPEEL